jgi:hypothetical protein
LEEAGEKQVIIDIWVLRQLLSRPPGIAAERPTKLTRTYLKIADCCRSGINVE